MILQTESVISVSKGGHMGNLNETPSANRLHIGIYGKTNSGKSSLINAASICMIVSRQFIVICRIIP